MRRDIYSEIARKVVSEEFESADPFTTNPPLVI